VDNDLYNYMRTFGDEGMSLVQVKSCMFQILCGIAFCHSCGILHRDLKPQNILVDQRTGNLKLADFGLSRAFGLPLRKYSREVVTLWYRPPEILLAASRYTTSVDIWSAGCIFAEMLNYQALFKGQSEIEQLFKIFSILGTPTEASFSECKALPNYSEEFPKWLPRSMNQWCPKLNECPAGQILLLSMLDYQADSRITARAALEDPYFTS